jgi:hypothetical protein
MKSIRSLPIGESLVSEDDRIKRVVTRTSEDVVCMELFDPITNHPVLTAHQNLSDASAEIVLADWRFWTTTLDGSPLGERDVPFKVSSWLADLPTRTLTIET